MEGAVQPRNESGLFGLSGADTDFLLLTTYMFVGACVYMSSSIYHLFGTQYLSPSPSKSPCV